MFLYNLILIYVTAISAVVIIAFSIHSILDTKKLKSKQEVRVYITDAEFHKLFCDAMEHLGSLSRNDIADKLLVSSPTISRWLHNKNLPHGAIRASIIEQLNKMVKKYQ